MGSSAGTLCLQWCALLHTAILCAACNFSQHAASTTPCDSLGISLAPRRRQSTSTRFFFFVIVVRRQHMAAPERHC
uniref:Putative secreted protein n=1 Tax=Anopheles darlingi TaxID=43151 RepID=A0A2M4DDQ3_ANODA